MNIYIYFAGLIKGHCPVPNVVREKLTTFYKHPMETIPIGFSNAKFAQITPFKEPNDRIS
jgi:hypothetical protein